MKWLSPIVAAAFILASTAGTAVASEYTEDTRELADEMAEELDPELKASAFLAIGHIGDDDQQESLEEFKDGGGQEERLAVGTALVLSGDSEAVEYLAEQVLEANDPRRALEELTIHLSDEQMVEVVDATLEEANDIQRDEIFSLLATRTGPLYNHLTQRLSADDESQRQAALEAVESTAGPDALEAAAQLQNHSDVEVRRQVFDLVDAVGDRGDQRSSIVEVLEAMTGDADEDLRYRAARKLVALGEDHGVDFLLDRLEEMEPERRVESMEWLIEHDAEADIDEIRPLIVEIERAQAADDDLDRDHEWQLLHELAATDYDSDLYDELREKFTSTEFEDRIASVRSLARTGRSEVKDQLLDGLGEGRSDIRQFSARGLGQLGDPDVLSELQTALRSETDQEVRLELVEAVGQIRDTESVNVLRFMVTDDDPDVRMAIVDALGEIGLPETSQALTILVRDQRDNISWNAFLTLLELDPDEARRHAGSVLRDPPDDFGQQIDPDGLSEEALELLYEEILSHSTSKVYSIGIRDAVAHPETIMPIARGILTSDELDEEARRQLTLLIADRAEDEDLARFERLVQRYGDEPAGELAGWYLAQTGDDTFDETFEYLVDSHEIGDDPTVRYLIANMALANME